MTFRTYRDLGGGDRSGLAAQIGSQRRRVGDRLRSVRRIVAVMSGKGGVGKSHVTALVALEAARARGLRTGVLDADLRSPTVARMLGVEGPLHVTDGGVMPALGSARVRVVSTDVLLGEGEPLRWREPTGDAFVWRGALEAAALREFLGDVVWGDLDLLLVDLPPGADGAVDLYALVPDIAGAVAVTIPTEEARRSVSRTMRSAADAGIPLLGVVENMSGYRCAECDRVGALFPGNAGSLLAEEFGVDLLAKIPLAPAAPLTEPPVALDAAIDAVLGGGGGAS